MSGKGINNLHNRNKNHCQTTCTYKKDRNINEDLCPVGRYLLTYAQYKRIVARLMVTLKRSGNTKAAGTLFSLYGNY